MLFQHSIQPLYNRGQNTKLNYGGHFSNHLCLCQQQLQISSGNSQPSSFGRIFEVLPHHSLQLLNTIQEIANIQ